MSARTFGLLQRLCRLWIASACLVMCFSFSAFAQDVTSAAEAALELRMRRITAELRCLVCQNQTIADSNSGLAQDLRRQVREMLRRGDDDTKIIGFMVDRYGEFVLYRPPVSPMTLLLWFGPALMFLAGFASLAIVMRRRASITADLFDPDDPALFVDPHQS